MLRKYVQVVATAALSAALALTLTAPAHADGYVLNHFSANDVTQPRGITPDYTRGVIYQMLYVNATSYYSTTAAQSGIGGRVHPNPSESAMYTWRRSNGDASIRIAQGQSMGLLCYTYVGKQLWFKADYRITNSLVGSQLFIGYFIGGAVAASRSFDFANFVPTCTA